MCLPDCRLQVRPTSQRCVQVSMKGCVSVVKGERENSGESPEGRSASSSCDKAPTQQLDPAVDPSSNIYPRTLRGGISFTLPVPSSLFVSLYSFSLSIQTSYLFSLPFPTLLCPICDPVSPLHFPLVSLRSGDMWIGAGESGTSSCLGMLRPPRSDANALPCGSQSDQAQA